jgi:uncharacterized protein YjiK
MDNRFLFILFCSTIILPLNSCGQKNRAIDFPYNLDRPEMNRKLPKVLEEISGLSYAGGNKVYCVQDEKGELFLYDLDKGEIEQQIPFGKPGDFEGIAKAGDRVYVIRSDGKLYSFEEPKTGREIGEVSQTRLELGSKCNVEGLGYDIGQNRLLVACKGESKKEGVEKRFYKVDLGSDNLKTEPLFSLSAVSIQNPGNWISRERYDNSGIPPGKVNTFNPSGIAAHPVTGDLYVLSSAGKLLIVMTYEGKIKQIVPLDSHLFVQPEGITFDREGNLFISNEGRGKHAVLYKFSFSKL